MLNVSAMPPRAKALQGEIFELLLALRVPSTRAAELPRGRKPIYFIYPVIFTDAIPN